MTKLARFSGSYARLILLAKSRNAHDLGAGCACQISSQSGSPRENDFASSEIKNDGYCTEKILASLCMSSGDNGW